jgi:plastocyanin
LNRRRDWMCRAMLAGLYTMIAACSVAFAQQATVTGRIEFSSTAANRTTDPSAVVVWLDAVGSSAAVPAAAGPQHRQLLQKAKTFSPHLLVVQVGSPVEFPNNDPFFHNVFSLFEGKRFDLGLYEAGATRTVVFNRAGISYVFCNIHPEMSAVVVALKTPYYGISDRTGTIVIPNVAPGRYEVHVWHERVLPNTLNALTHTITISETSSSLGVIRLTEERSLPEPHKNKYGRDYDVTRGVPAYSRP